MANRTVVTTYPPCDLCKSAGENRDAHYDGRMKQGPWAYMCDTHWAPHGVGKLGTGFGQRLVCDESGQSSE